MTASELIDQAFKLFLNLLQFIYDWTIGIIARAVSQNPQDMGIIHLILWIVVLLFVIGILVRLVILLAAFFASLFPSRDYRYYYRNPYFVSAGLAWICALVLVYANFTDIPLR